MDSAMGEEMKIPLLGSNCSPYIRRAVFIVVLYVAVCALLIFCMLPVGYKVNHLIQPELRLTSLVVCPMINESVIWDLKFDVINNDTDDYIFVHGFEVSVFLYNQTKLLAKANTSPVSSGDDCIIGPGNRASLIGLAEASTSSIQDININGTIHLDLKLHNGNYDLVCGDVKVSVSSSSSSLHCGSMVGDPFACSYQPHKSDTSLIALWINGWRSFCLFVPAV